MSVLKHIRDIPFFREHVRFLQSTVVVFRAHVVQTSPSTSADHSAVAREQVLFDDGSRIFAVKRTSDMLRSLFVLKLCSYDIVARKSSVVRKKIWFYFDGRRRVNLIK